MKTQSNSGSGVDVQNGTSERSQQVISDPEWIRLKELSGLPDIARAEIDDVVRFYRKYRPIEESWLPPASLRDQLVRWRDKIEEARSSILHLAHNPQSYGALWFVLEDSFSTVDEFIAETGERLAELSSHLDAASKALPLKKQKPDNKTLWVAINAINGFLFIHTRQTLKGKGSKKKRSFAYEILKIADPTIEEKETSNMIRNHLVSVEHGREETLGVFMNAVRDGRMT
jgi:hypothetical protein